MLSPINPKSLQELQGLGGEQLVTKMVEQFIQDVETWVEDLETALSPNEGSKVFDAIHGLRGICANMGIKKLQILSPDIEKFCRQVNVLESQAFFEQLKKEMKPVVRNLRQQHLRTCAEISVNH